MLVEERLGFVFVVNLKGEAHEFANIFIINQQKNFTIFISIIIKTLPDTCLGPRYENALWSALTCLPIRPAIVSRVHDAIKPIIALI